MNLKYDVDQYGFVQVSPPGLPVVLADKNTSKAAEVHGVAIDETGRASSNPKDIASRGKCPVQLVPSVLVRQVAQVLRSGADKYGEWSWRTEPVQHENYRAAAMRHLLAILDGEDRDAESGLSHWAHVAATAAIVLDAEKCGTLIDDRPRT